MVDMNKMAATACDIARARQANGGNVVVDTVSMLKHTATEVVEAMQAYDKYVFDDYKVNFAAELADIICCVMIIAANEDIDIERCMLECLAKNRKRAEGRGDKK